MHFLRLKLIKLINFRAPKMAKMVVLEVLESPKLISYNIWMTGKWWNLNTLLVKFEFLFFEKSFFRCWRCTSQWANPGQSMWWPQQRLFTSKPNRSKCRGCFLPIVSEFWLYYSYSASNLVIPRYVKHSTSMEDTVWKIRIFPFKFCLKSTLAKVQANENFLRI